MPKAHLLPDPYLRDTSRCDTLLLQSVQTNSIENEQISLDTNHSEDLNKQIYIFLAIEGPKVMQPLIFMILR